jgi:hypothetical protein
VTLDYRAFLERKAVAAPMRGLTEIPTPAEHLFPHQAHCVAFGLAAGSFGCFLDTGLGKTAVELDYSDKTLPHHNGYGLILTPLAVARQIETEGNRWGYDCRVIRQQSEARPGINICNYDRLDLLEPSAFGSIALDESSILKSFTGKTTRSLIEAFSGHRWRMAATATPAPNDHVELAQHAEFLGLMGRDEMLVRWFINDGSDTKSWRLKRHAVDPFFDWMASWCRMAEHPRDLGFDVAGFDLPPLRIHRHRTDEAPLMPVDGALFATAQLSATTVHDVKRQTSAARAAAAAELAIDGDHPCVVWVDTDYEADALLALIGKRRDVVEIRGSHTIERKEAAIASFLDGSKRVLITKSAICGFGLNLQFCNRTVFVGRSFSYESWYQAVRRFWRFGQTQPVDVHLIVAEGEDQIGRVIDRKTADHQRMKSAMRDAMRRAQGRSATVRQAYNPTHDGALPSWLTTRTA